MDEAGGGLPVAEAHLSFGRYVRLVQDVLEVPAATVSVVTESRADLSQAVRDLVVKETVPIAVADVHADERLQDISLKPGYVACLGVPLRRGDEVYGALCALDESSRAWTDRDVHLTTGLGAACAAELTLRDSRAQVQASQQSAVRHSRLLLAMSEALTRPAPWTTWWTWCRRRPPSSWTPRAPGCSMSLVTTTAKTPPVRCGSRCPES